MEGSATTAIDLPPEGTSLHLTRGSRPTGFAPGVAEMIGFYVYLLIDPDDDRVFYIGKGTGNRCFAHLEEARKTSADTIADYEKLARIREIESTGAAVKIDILRHGLSEIEAFHIESAAIDLLRLTSLTNRVSGHDTAERGRMTVSEINILYGAQPVEIDSSHQVVLIRINRNFERGIADGALYDVTRRWWKIAGFRRQIGTRYAPDLAMAVYDGVVYAVYRIEAWERPSDVGIDFDPKDASRWGFIGKRDATLEKIYLHRDVSTYLRAAQSGNPSQNPIRYVNCGE